MMKRWIGGVLVSWAGLVPLSGWAAGVATVQAGDRTLTVSFDGTAARVDIGGISQGYLLLRDDTLYTILQMGGRALVMDGAAVAQLLGGRALKMGPDMIQSLTGITPTGDHETVAGRPGAVYTVSYQDAQGRDRSGRAVLGDQPDVRELSQVLGRLAVQLQRVAGGTAAAEQPHEGVLQVQETLASRGLGVLAYEQKFRVETLTTTPPAAGTLDLPAAAAQLPSELGQLLHGLTRPSP